MSVARLLDLAAASGVVGVFVPLLVALVNQAHWASWVKGVVTAGMSTIAGLATDWQQGAFHGLNWIATSVLVLLVASGAYQAFWKPSRIAPLIEAATTFAKAKLPAAPAKPAA